MRERELCCIVNYDMVLTSSLINVEHYAKHHLLDRYIKSFYDIIFLLEISLY